MPLTTLTTTKAFIAAAATATTTALALYAAYDARQNVAMIDASVPALTDPDTSSDDDNVVKPTLPRRLSAREAEQYVKERPLAAAMGAEVYANAHIGIDKNTIYLEAPIFNPARPFETFTLACKRVATKDTWAYSGNAQYDIGDITNIGRKTRITINQSVVHALTIDPVSYAPKAQELRVVIHTIAPHRPWTVRSCPVQSPSSKPQMDKCRPAEEMIDMRDLQATQKWINNICTEAYRM